MHATPPPSGAPRPSGPAGPVFLVVDDEPEIRTTCAAALRRAFPGATVLTASHGAEGLEALAGAAVDVILSDYKMPGMDGIRFLALARERSPRSDRVLVTAYPDDTMAVQAVNEARIERFLTKPFPMERLLAMVREILSARQAEAQRSQAFARSLDALRRELEDERARQRASISFKRVDQPYRGGL